MPFLASCGVSMRKVSTRDTDETFREAQGTGAEPTVRREAVGAGAATGGECTSGERIVQDAEELGVAAPSGRIAAASPGGTFRTPGTAVQIGVRGTGAITEGGAAGRPVCQGAVDAAPDCAADRKQVLGLDGTLLAVFAARSVRRSVQCPSG